MSDTHFKHHLTSQEGLVSVSHPLAAKVGKDILDKGGTAVDAVVAIQLVLNVVEPFASGLGGGGYLLYYDSTVDDITAFYARETAPSNVDPHFYLDEKGHYKSFLELTTHGSIVGVPGIAKLFEHLHNHYCNLNLEDLINPAIELAEHGHRANWAIEKYSKQQIKRINKYDETRRVFTKEDDDYIHDGDWLKSPEIARTLRLLRDKGFGAFYTGNIAKQLVNVVNKYGGTINEEDLKHYNIRIKQPITAQYRGYQIHSMGPSSSGGITLIQILKILEPFDLKSMGSRSIDYLHHLIQAMQIAYSDRAKYIADDDFYEVPVSELIDEDYLKQRNEIIDQHIANFNIEHGELSNSSRVESHTHIDETHTETTHFSVTDRFGNVASFTTSIGMIYGSGITIPGYGVLLNTTMDGFDVISGGINEIEPHKRPLSNMAPTIITENGKPIMEVGAPGAISIIASVVQTIINVLDFGMSIQEAIDEPRIYTSNPSRIEWEPKFDQTLILKLIAKGHAFEHRPDPYIGDVHGLQFLENGVIGGADNTREGTVAGGPVYYVREKENDLNIDDFTQYHIEYNHVRLPLFKNQIIKEHGDFWLRNDVVELLFDINEKDYEVEYFIEKQGQDSRFINIEQLTHQLNYQVHKTENGISIYKDTKQRITETQAKYYRYDRDSITR